MPRKATLISKLKTTSPIALLQDFGYENIWQTDDIKALTLETAKQTLKEADVPLEKIGSLFYASGLPDSRPKDEDNPLSIFEYPLSALQSQLGLQQSSGIAISQRGCSSFLIALQQAVWSLQSTEQTHALCVAADAWPHQNREVMYNLLSDAACSLLLEKNPRRPYFQPIMAYEYTHAYYTSPSSQEQELLAAYFPIAQKTILNCLEGVHLGTKDLAWVVPHNVNRNSWKILSAMLEIPMEKIWMENIPRVGHTISCDQIINTVDMQKEKLFKNEDYILWFTFGFGASWLAMILQYHE